MFVTIINLKILIYIFIFLSSCSSHISNEFSDNTTSTQIKSNEFKLNKEFKLKILKTYFLSFCEQIRFQVQKQQILDFVYQLNEQ